MSVGAYQKGSDVKIDEALQKYPLIQQFLSQSFDEAVNLEESVQALESLLIDVE